MRRSKEIIHQVQFSSCASVIGCLSIVRKVLILLNPFRFRQMAHAIRAVNKLCIKRAEKPHSIIQRPQGAERPCYEAEDSACRGEWRREAGSQCARLMPARERERGGLPH